MTIKQALRELRGYLAVQATGNETAGIKKAIELLED